MKRIFSIILAALMILSSAACGSGNQQEEQKGFEPELDAATACKISIVGSYSNFEALEAEFDRFNEYYPNVEMSYTKIDDYNNSIAAVLNGNDAPNIFFSFSWMTGNAAYDSVFACMENLADDSLGLDLDCIRPGLLNRDAQGNVLTVPIFSTSYGMLINNDLFEKEGLKVPATLRELIDVCASFSEKGYESPMMGYSAKSSGCMMSGGCILERSDTGIGRIDGRTTLVERLLLGIHADLRRLQTGHTHLQVNERLARLLFERTSKACDVANGCTAEITKTHRLDRLGHNLII